MTRASFAPEFVPRLPPAIVLSCLGGEEGSLSVTRSLGEAGVPVIVIAEYHGGAADVSRYTTRCVHVPTFTTHPERLTDAIREVGSTRGCQPVVFPTADPDTSVLTRIRADLDGHAKLILTGSELVTDLLDKRRFAALAAGLGLPVPTTHMPSSIADVRALSQTLRYPAVLKPSHPHAWYRPDVPRAVWGAKALIIEDALGLLTTCEPLAIDGIEFIIQEYVNGSDAEHYDVHAFITQVGDCIATFTGRKRRVFPPHAGSGCFVEGVREPALEALAVEVLRSVGYHGIANLNFKRDAQTGEFRLLEINPRVSQWTIFDTRCGVNLPLLAYREACGLPLVPPGPPRISSEYVHESNDLRAFREYRRMGELSTRQYLWSLVRRPKTFQWLSARDPRPAIRLLGRWVRGRWRRIRVA